MRPIPSNKRILRSIVLLVVREDPVTRTVNGHALLVKCMDALIGFDAPSLTRTTATERAPCVIIDFYDRRFVWLSVREPRTQHRADFIVRHR